MELEVVLLIEIVFFQVKQLNVLIPGSENLIFSGVMGNIQKAVGILQCCCSTHRPTENVQGDTSKKNGGFSSSDTVAAKLASHTAEGTEECAQGKAAEANAAGGRIGQLNDLLDGPGTAELLSEPPLDDVPRWLGAVPAGQRHCAQCSTIVVVVVVVVVVLESMTSPSTNLLAGTGVVDKVQKGSLGAVWHPWPAVCQTTQAAVVTEWKLSAKRI